MEREYELLVSGKFRFAAVISHPIQHYAPIFRELARVPGIEVKVFHCTDWGVKPSFDKDFGQTFAWDVPLLDGYDSEFLASGIGRRPFGFFEVDNPELTERLNAFQPHAIWIHGYAHRSCWRALRWAQGRCACFFFGDSELLRPRAFWRRCTKKLVVQWFLRKCDAIITVGDNNEAYYRHYGVPQEKFYRGACPIDLERFRACLNQEDRSTRERLRARYGIPSDALVVLFSGKLISLKRPLDLVYAIGLLHDRGLRPYCLFVGDGPLRLELERVIADQAMQQYIKLTGFVNQNEIPLFLAAADILAIPSERDAHPLAVTESMAVGHPIVASDRIGCVGPTDTARPNVNALVYPVGDINAMADCLQQLILDDPLRNKMSVASIELVRTQTPEATVVAILQGILALRTKFRAPWSDVSVESFQAMHHCLQSRLPSSFLTVQN